jgi:serine/threonine protein kinase
MTSKVYTLEGKIEDIDLVFYNQYIFKKMTTSKVELEICRILIQNPHKNIVEIFEVGEDYVIMEQVDISQYINLDKMLELKDYLQDLGIIYIDWKPDNIGSKNGELKLFDFNVSGLIDVETQNWIIEAKHYYAYNQAIEKGYITPIEIDNYAFTVLSKSRTSFTL